ncbi:hypothetical protein BD779DRAFT_1559124 [Infundibulicybe gibba]|nr:hypothetical protein BD779DRAFT_1559124 [Infundibulicybe gibba]
MAHKECVASTHHFSSLICSLFVGALSSCAPATVYSRPWGLHALELGLGEKNVPQNGWEGSEFARGCKSPSGHVAAGMGKWASLGH